MVMSVDEARAKWEPAFWNAYYSSRQVGDHGFQMLVRVMNGMAADGYYVDVIKSAQDPSLTGLAFHEISSTAIEKHRRGGIAMDYGSIFISARQRAAAYKFYEEFSWERSTYGFAGEVDYLKEAYSFLCKPAHRDFIEFCAKKEAMTFDKYCDVMGINVDELVAREPLTTIEDGQCITQKTR